MLQLYFEWHHRCTLWWKQKFSTAKVFSFRFVTYTIVFNINPCFTATFSSGSEYVGNISFSKMKIFKLFVSLTKTNICLKSALILASTIWNSLLGIFICAATSIWPQGKIPKTDVWITPDVKPITRRFKIRLEFDLVDKLSDFRAPDESELKLGNGGKYVSWAAYRMDKK